MIEPGKTGAYLALFSEIGFILFVLTLGGALGGHWLDQQLGIRFPVFLLTGLLLGMAARCVGHSAADQPVPRAVQVLRPDRGATEESRSKLRRKGDD